jgi:RNA polymerase sigma factor (sigma-70 family)
MLNSSEKTVADIIAIVNYAIGKLRRSWNITDLERDDLQQDGYIAAIAANKTYDPRLSAWSTWILKRVNGQLKTSLARLRSCGITGSRLRTLQMNEIRQPRIDSISSSYMTWDRDDEESDHEFEIADESQVTDEAADTTSIMEALGNCVSERSRQVLTLYYGLDGSPSLTTVQLAERLGFSKKHAFALLQRAQNEARACLAH